MKQFEDKLKDIQKVDPNFTEEMFLAEVQELLQTKTKILCKELLKNFGIDDLSSYVKFVINKKIEINNEKNSTKKENTSTGTLQRGKRS